MFRCRPESRPYQLPRGQSSPDRGPGSRLQGHAAAEPVRSRREATGSCILTVREGRVYTPPATEGAVASITLQAVEALAHTQGIPFERRPIDRTELLVADELAICGTLAEVVSVRKIEGRPLPADSPILKALQTSYFHAVRGIASHPNIEMTKVILRQ